VFHVFVVEWFKSDVMTGVLEINTIPLRFTCGRRGVKKGLLVVVGGCETV
jgi:hypothetical protein